VQIRGKPLFQWSNPIQFISDKKFHITKTRNSAIADKPRDAFRGQWRSPNLLPFHMLSMVGFLLVSYSNFVHKTKVFWGIRLQKCRDLENRVRGPSRSLEMPPFVQGHMTSYWRSIVTVAISHVVSEIINVEKYRDLEIPVKGQSRSLKVVPFEGFGMVYY